MAFSLKLKRVLISDSVDSCCKTILEANGIAVDLKTKLTKEQLLAEIQVRHFVNWNVSWSEHFVLLHWSLFFSSHTSLYSRIMMVWSSDQQQKWLQMLSKLAKISKSSAVLAPVLTTSISRQLPFKELLSWSKFQLLMGTDFVGSLVFHRSTVI